ncbi:MAG: hypothetical protein V4661_09915 [Pseudomonadota bacterium]
MQIRNTGWAVLIAVAAMCLCISGSAQAAKAGVKTAAKSSVAAADKPIVLAKFNKRRTHTAKKSKAAQPRHARKASSKVTKVSSGIPGKKSGEIKASRRAAKDERGKDEPKIELSDSVANARAEVPRSNALAEDEAKNIAALDSKDVLAVNGVQVAAADLTNDVDRTLAEQATATPSPAPADAAPVQGMKIIKAMPTGERQVLKADDSDTWNKTSLIGKIFIAFGGLLTLASAARMMIA